MLSSAVITLQAALPSAKRSIGLLCQAAVLAILCGALAAPAQAADPARRTSAWTGGQGPATGGPVAFCVAQADYSNGLALMIAKSRGNSVTLSMIIPGLRAARGAQWSVLMRVDDVEARYRAQVLEVLPSGAWIAIPLPEDSRIPQALFSGRVLTVTSSADQAAFDLDGVAEVMGGLGNCVARLRR